MVIFEFEVRLAADPEGLGAIGVPEQGRIAVPYGCGVVPQLEEARGPVGEE